MSESPRVPTQAECSPPGTVPATRVQHAAALIANALTERADRYCVGDAAEERRAAKLNDAIAALSDANAEATLVETLRLLVEALNAEPEPGCPVCNAGIHALSVVGKTAAASAEWLECSGCGIKLSASGVVVLRAA